MRQGMKIFAQNAKCWWQIFGQSKNYAEESKNDEEEIRESGKFREFTHVRAQAEGDQPMRTPVIVPAAHTLILTRLGR